MRWKGFVEGREFEVDAAGGENGWVCGTGGGEKAGFAASLDCDAARLKYGFRDSSATGPGLETGVASCALSLDEGGGMGGAAVGAIDRALLLRV
jgi:hypothetical protein